MQTVEANAALVRRFLTEVISTGNTALADELCTPEFTSYFGGMPGPIAGRDAWKQMAGAYFAAFPDMRVGIEDLIAEGDRVAVHWTWHATQAGPFMDIPA